VARSQGAVEGAASEEMSKDPSGANTLRLCLRDDDYSVVNAFIETPKGEHHKYDFDPATGFLTLDRRIHTSLVFPGNYGFLPETESGDGDPLDVLILSEFPLYPCSVVACRVIGVIQMKDEKGMDPKIIAAIHRDARMLHINDIGDVPHAIVEELRHFFIHIKDLEPGKWAEAAANEDVDVAKSVIRQCHLARGTGNA
jgi:inorganic pyrophosphatase